MPPDTAALQISRLPAAGLVLTKGWRYHPGDNPAWARPDFDDSAWDTLNPTRPQRQLPARLGTGINWLRLHFELGDSLRQRALLLLTSTSGGLGAVPRWAAARARRYRAPRPDSGAG